MGPDYEWDDKKAVANATKHGVDFADAIAVFDDTLAVTIPDPDAVGEARFVTLGLDAFRRVLVVVYAESADGIRIISARRATRKERRDHAI